MRGPFAAAISVVMAAWLACPAVAVPAAAEARATLAVDPTTSRVRIALGRSGLLKFLGHDHTIEAPVESGRVEIVDGDPVRSSVSLRFESRRLAIVPGTEPAGDVPVVEARMRGPEVLDAERFPAITFESSAVAAEPPPEGASDAPGTLRLRVRGTLAVRDRAVALEIPLAARQDADGLSVVGEASLDLRTLGIEPPSVAGVVKVARRFRLSFELHAR
jgi:polyisoprenoid-binding protein YceI